MADIFDQIVGKVLDLLCIPHRFIQTLGGGATMKYEIGSGRTALCYDIRRYGEDILLHIGGGKQHIGSVSLGEHGKLVTHLFPEHKEDSLTEHAARELSFAFPGNIVVSAGVHLDAITKAEIETILSLNEKAVASIIRLLEQAEGGTDED